MGRGFCGVRKGTLNVDVIRTISYSIFKHCRIQPVSKLFAIVIFIISEHPYSIAKAPAGIFWMKGVVILRIPSIFYSPTTPAFISLIFRCSTMHKNHVIAVQRFHRFRRRQHSTIAGHNDDQHGNITHKFSFFTTLLQPNPRMNNPQKSLPNQQNHYLSPIFQDTL